jgi:hypothetical protein
MRTGFLGAARRLEYREVVMEMTGEPGKISRRDAKPQRQAVRRFLGEFASLREIAFFYDHSFGE